MCICMNDGSWSCPSNFVVVIVVVSFAAHTASSRPPPPPPSQMDDGLHLEPSCWIFIPRQLTNE